MKKLRMTDFEPIQKKLNDAIKLLERIRDNTEGPHIPLVTAFLKEPEEPQILFIDDESASSQAFDQVISKKEAESLINLVRHL